MEPTGFLNWRKETKVEDIDQLGIAVTLYFKLLKSIVMFFSFVVFMSIPLYILYSSGEMQASSNSSILSKVTLGNLGQSVI